MRLLLSLVIHTIYTNPYRNQMGRQEMGDGFDLGRKVERVQWEVGG